MRRRRNAAASTDEVAADEVSIVPETTVPAEPDTTAGLTAAPPADETPKPRRRAAATRRRTPDTEIAVEADIVAIEAVAPSQPAAETEPAAAAEESTETPPPAPRSRRSSTRRRKGAETPDEPVAVTEPEPESLPELVLEPVPETIVVDPTDASPGGERSGRRRGRGRGRGGSGSGGSSETTNETPPSASVDTSTGPKPRTRGLRRSPAGETPPAPATIAVPVIDTPVASGKTDAAPRRVRGLRRAAPASVAAAAQSAPAAAAAIAEPLPPVYKPLPEETLARLPKTRVVVRNNVPELIVNSEPRLPLWFFVNTEDNDARDVAQREIRYAYEAGIRTFTVLAHLPWKMRSGERRYDVLDEILQFVTDNAPEALILPRLIFSPPMSWERAHPGEMTAYADGETGDVSLASRAFWEGEAEEALRAAVEHVAEGPHAGRVFGFYLEHGEWLYEKGRGYDISEASTLGFRSWLRVRYKSSVVALRAAWNDSAVAFDTAEVPLQPVPQGPTLFFSAREQRYADFHEYASDIVAQVIIRLGRAVKEASGGRSAVAVSYGYTLEMPRAASGHLALGQVLASPFIDILTGPVSYSGRTPGGSAPFPAPVQSITLAGKLWISEDDTKTFLSSGETPDPYNPKVSSYEGTSAAYARNFGAALASGAGVSWMDLWGLGWLDDRELWTRIGRLKSFAEEIAARRRAPESPGLPDPDVAVIVDERSFFDVRADETLLSQLIANQRDALLRSGARVGFYLLSDLLKGNFPTGPKLLLFLNAFHIPEAVRTAIKERFQREGRTLAYLYAPGSRETNLGELSETIGMQLKLQPWGSKMGTQILSNVRSPLTENLKGQRIGEDARINPSYYVADSRAQVLGEYTATGNPSIAVRKHARWQSVFIGETQLSLPLLRGLYRLAGVPIYTVDDDAAWIGDGLICLHSAPGGGTTVFLPEEGALYDVLADETLAANGHGARISMPPRGTRLLFFGTPDAVSRLGGNPAAAPDGLIESELPPPPAAFVFEGPADKTPDTVSAEDVALMKAALAADLLIDKDSEAPEAAALGDIRNGLVAPVAGETGDAAAKKKRRRRRRRRAGEAEDAVAGDLEGVDIGDEGEEDSADEASDDSAEPATTAGFEPNLFDEAQEAADPAPVRVRPSLAELLPDSDFTDGAELPPIPDEFLPIDAAAFTTGAADAPSDEAAPRAPRRPRSRGGARRGQPPVSESELTPSLPENNDTVSDSVFDTASEPEPATTNE